MDRQPNQRFSEGIPSRQADPDFRQINSGQVVGASIRRPENESHDVFYKFKGMFGLSMTFKSLKRI
jgi:hypothetical protein